MAKKKKSKRKLEPAEMPMSAMIDVTFLLLIYFITTQSEVKSESFIAINLSTPNKNPPPEDIPITMDVYVFENRYVFQNRPYPTIEDITPVIDGYIENSGGDAKETIVNLKLQGDATQQKLVDICDLCAKNGLTKVNTFFVKDGLK